MCSYFSGLKSCVSQSGKHRHTFRSCFLQMNSSKMWITKSPKRFLISPPAHTNSEVHLVRKMTPHQRVRLLLFLFPLHRRYETSLCNSTGRGFGDAPRVGPSAPIELFWPPRAVFVRLERRRDPCRSRSIITWHSGTYGPVAVEGEGWVVRITGEGKGESKHIRAPLAGANQETRALVEEKGWT